MSHNTNPRLKAKLSNRLLRYIGATPNKSTRPSSSSITCTVSPALYDQVLAFVQREHTSTSKAANHAIRLFMSAKLSPPNPMPRPIQTRTRGLSATIKDPQLFAELKAFADSQGLTVSAIVRRALYEYTLPETSDQTNPATADAWGDRPVVSKLVDGLG